MKKFKKKLALVIAIVMVLVSVMTCSTVSIASTDVAQGKTTTASSTLSGYPAGNANDGNSTTVWCASGSKFSQWWRVDLGGNYDLTGTSLTLAPSGATFKYKVEVSSDGSAYTAKVDKTSAFYSGTQTDNFTVSSVRYVRITLTASGTSDWASLSNVQVYGTASGGGGAANLALGKTAVASSIEGTGLEANKATDGNVSTRWGSVEAVDPQWIYVDLGSTKNINRVKLVWEDSYAKSYKIQISDNSTSWSDVYSTTTGDGATDDISFTANTGRYVRMYGTVRGTSWGYSLYEFEVYGDDSMPQPPATPTGLAATAVSASKINVTWNTVSGATSYDLEVDGVSNSSVTSPYAHTGLTAGSTHSYRVRAANSAGASAWSNTVSATALSGTLPPINNPPSVGFPPNSDDHREYMHGIDLLKVDGNTMLVFSSNNYPPTKPTGEWYHNIYYSWIDPLYPNETLNIQTMVNADLAQEPASAAVNSNGRIVVTAEDAQFDPVALDQTFGMWDSALNVISNYGVKLMPPQGGHSGHVAASGDKFLVSFSDGWIDGGAVDNLGTGDEIYGKIINNDGTTGSLINTSVGTTRDWWPIVAGSDTNWLQVWQRYTGVAGTGGGTVWGAVISQTGSIVKKFQIYDNNKYYYHDVKYLPNLGLYLVLGSQNLSANGGIAVLIDKSGNIVKTQTGLPNTVREGQTAIYEDGNTVKAVYPTLPTGAAVLDITSTSITLSKTLSCSYEWDYMGVAGIFSAPTRVLFAANSYKGIRFIMFDI